MGKMENADLQNIYKLFMRYQPPQLETLFIEVQVYNTSDSLNCASANRFFGELKISLYKL